ncbi:MAG: hypothetical protein ACR2KT_15090 [Methylocella sp.]
MMALPSCHSGYRCRHPRPNEVLAQRQEKTAHSTAPVKRPAHANLQSRFRLHQSYQNVSRETFLSDRGEKSSKAKDSGAVFELVRLIDYQVHFTVGGGGAPMGGPVAGTHRRCKFRQQNRGLLKDQPTDTPARRLP